MTARETDADKGTHDCLTTHKHMERTIRKAAVWDLPVIRRLIESGRKLMRENGNPLQWGDHHPSNRQFQHDIAQGCSYLLLQDGAPIATFAFIPGPDDTYAKIYQGSWLEAGRPYHVIHRVAREHGVHGVMRDIFDYCFSVADNIRIDTHRDNTLMQRALVHAGFSYRGIIFLASGDERLAYQKITDRQPAAAL